MGAMQVELRSERGASAVDPDLFITHRSGSSKTDLWTGSMCLNRLEPTAVRIGLNPRSGGVFTNGLLGDISLELPAQLACPLTMAEVRNPI